MTKIFFSKFKDISKSCSDFFKTKYWGGYTNEDFKSSKEYVEWVQLLGGETNVWLREFLRQFRLA